MKELSKRMQEQFNKMCETGKLFRSKVSGQALWDLYISSFIDKYNPIFRDPSSTINNCNLCSNFIHRYGNIVAVDINNRLMSIFDANVEEEYKQPFEVLSNVLKSNKIDSIFVETFDSLKSLPYEKCNKSNTKFRLGVESNTKRYTSEEANKYGVVKPDQLIVFNHMHLDIPASFIDISGKSEDSLIAISRDNKNVFERGLREIHIDTLNLVVDLINQDSLLDGKSHLHKVTDFLKYAESFNNNTKSYDSLIIDNWIWFYSVDYKYAKFKNELIGVLCSELSEGKDLNEACKAWNKRVDPVNYMKTTASITTRQINEAREFVINSGYEESFDRRVATLDDIAVDNILHINSGDGAIKEVTIFDNVKATSTRHKRNEFDGVEVVTIDKFMKDILPKCSSVELFLTNNLENNLVTITTANVKNSKPIFKWNNNYSWTFKGNLAGKSEIKQAVKIAGGNVDGVMRFSLMWNESGNDNSDLDAWCIEPNRVSIGYSTGFRKDRLDRFSPSGGQLDIDVISPNGKVAVENIYYRSLSEMKNGDYTFYVNPYSINNSQGFKAEIEYDGNIYTYIHNGAVKSRLTIATINFNNGVFKIDHNIKPSNDDNSSKTIYSLETNSFHKVNLVCLSPNHWNSNNFGNKYYMFMLDGCKLDESIRGFHIENLSDELLNHKRVLEVLGSTTMIKPNNNIKNQLSGIGFNSTVRNSVILKLGGTFKRVIKVEF